MQSSVRPGSRIKTEQFACGNGFWHGNDNMENFVAPKPQNIDENACGV